MPRNTDLDKITSPPSVSAGAPAPDRIHWQCDFNSGAYLRISPNAAHVVIRVRESVPNGGHSAAIGLVPAKMRALGRQLIAMADEYDALSPSPERGR